MKKQAEGLSKEYDRLMQEHSTLQVCVRGRGGVCEREGRYVGRERCVGRERRCGEGEEVWGGREVCGEGGRCVGRERRYVKSVGRCEEGGEVCGEGGEVYGEMCEIVQFKSQTLLPTAVYALTKWWHYLVSDAVRQSKTAACIGYLTM